MPVNGLQRSSLQINRQEVLEGTSGHEDEAKAPSQIQLTHVLADQGHTITHGSRSGARFPPCQTQHAIGDVDASDLQSCLSQRQCDATGATSEFKHASAGFPRKALVESNITANGCTADVKCIIGPNEQRVCVLIELV